MEFSAEEHHQGTMLLSVTFKGFREAIQFNPYPSAEYLKCLRMAVMADPCNHLVAYGSAHTCVPTLTSVLGYCLLVSVVFSLLKSPIAKLVLYKNIIYSKTCSVTGSVYMDPDEINCQNQF